MSSSNYPDVSDSSWLDRSSDKCLIIAEAGVNHNGSLSQAIALVDAAAEAGADVVKFQTFCAADLVLESAPLAPYQERNMGEGCSQFEMLSQLELTEEDHLRLIERCQQRGIEFMSSPFSVASADLLERLGITAYKIGSGELTNLPLLSHVASFGKPMIVSTGMSTLGEIEEAIDAIVTTGNRRIVLLHCVSDYPAAAESVNLRAMETIASAFGLPVGFSDHTTGIDIALAAVARGARVLEKHFTLDKTLPGPDHRASLEPVELGAMVAGVRRIADALGDGVKRPRRAELETARIARKSLVASRAIPAGTLLTEEFVECKRPGVGLAPGLLGQLLNRRTLYDLPAGHLFELRDVA